MVDEEAPPGPATSLLPSEEPRPKGPCSILFLLNSCWTWYHDILELYPLIVKSVTAFFILGAGDLCGQAFQGGDTGIDWPRVVRFAVFGLVLQAPWNHYYYLVLDGWLPPTTEPWTKTTFIKLIIDQFVQAPIFTVLIFAFLGGLEGKNVEQILDQLKEQYVATMLANWQLWIPAQAINIAFVPPILRVLYLNIVFFFWSIILSVILHSSSSS